MQKNAFEKKLPTIYQPISFSEEAICYTDPTPAILPDRDIEVLHYHDCIEIGICLKGSGLFLLGNRVESVSEGDALFIPPAVHHYSQQISTTTCICAFIYLEPRLLEKRFHIDGCSVAALLKKHTAPKIFKRDTAEALTALAERIYTAAKEHDELLCALRVMELLITSPASDTVDNFMPNDTDTPVSAVAAYMALHYREPLSNRALAELSHLSESQLRRRFLASYGLPPHAYLNRLRCRIGAEMLTYTARTIEDISEAIGYGSASDFYRHFKECFGSSPTAWRKQRSN